MTQDGSGMANVHAQIVYLETNVRGLTKGDTDGPDDVVRLPTSGRTPTLASLAAGTSPPCQVYSPAHPERGHAGR